MIHLGRIFILLGMAFLFSRAVFAGEPDDFMARADKKAPLANDLINANLNAQLQNVLIHYMYLASDNGTRTIDPQATCSREKILALMADSFDRNFPDIYAPYGSSAAYEMTAGAKTSEDTMMKDWVRVHGRMWVPSYRVKTKSGEHVMGIDKIDHFFAHGYLGWVADGNAKKSDRQKRHLDVLKFNLEQEKGPWGLKGSKVKSYADLSANELGHQFWRDLLDAKDPIFQCVNGTYVMKKPFDLFKYLDASVDETINCNSYSSKGMRDAIVAHSKNLGVQCPTKKETCKVLTNSRSKAVSELTLHPLCRGEKDSQVEEPSLLKVADVIKMGASLTGVTNLLPFWFGARKNNVALEKPKNASAPAVQIWAGPLENSMPIEANSTPKTNEAIKPSGALETAQ